jgi:hypothetical protein
MLSHRFDPISKEAVMKHLGKVFGISSLFVLVLSVSSFAQNWGYGPVVVFDKKDGGGTASSFGIGEFRNNRGEFGTLRNDSARSVSVPNGYRVRFCESEGSRGEGSGRCEEFGEGNANLRYGGTASYIQVTGPSGNWGGGWNGGGQRGVTVYEDRDYTGRSQQFGIGRYLNGYGQFGELRNDKASSVVVDRGFRVRLCENEGDGRGSGRCEEYTEGRYNLRYNDSASYIEVQRSGGWGNGGWGNGGWNNGGWDNGGWGNNDRNPTRVTLYVDANQRGGSRAFDDGIYRWSQGEFGNFPNDAASSVFVPNGYRIRICENEGRGSGERCEDFGPGRFNLRYNDVASTIEVRRGNSGRFEIGNGGGWGDNNGGWNGGGWNSGNAVIVYEDANQRGNQQSFGIGQYRWIEGQFGALQNDAASSVFVPQGLRVRLCENEGRGIRAERCEEYGPGRYNLRYNDSASYVEVRRN